MQKIHNITVGRKKLKVKYAKTNKEKEKGLKFITKLPDASGMEGMLFLYDEKQYLSYWMKDTKIPLSIAFIDENYNITQIEDLEPLSQASVRSNFPVKFALEVNKGWFRDNNVKVNDKIKFKTDKIVKINVIK